MTFRFFPTRLSRNTLFKVVFLMLLCATLSPAQNIKKFEYFIDNDPGYGLATQAVPTIGPAVTDFPISIPTTSLSSGFHRVLIRAQETSGKWTSTVFFNFFIVAPGPSSGTVTAMEYFVDTDPGFGAGSAVAVSPAATLPNVAVNVSTSSLAAGFHKIFVRAKSANGTWSQVTFSTFYIAKIVPPTNIVKFEYFFDTDPGFDNGVAAPVATPAPTVTDMNILAVPSSRGQGAHIIYVRAKDSAGNWTSVISQNFIVDPPSACVAGIPVVTNGSGCENTAITMTATGAAGSQTYRWYDVATGGSSLSSAGTYAPTLSASATYYVSIYDSGANCEGTRSTVTATVVSAPAKPAITVTGSLAFCPGGTVTLDAPSGFSGYAWSDATTLQSRTVSATASLTVQVANASGCKSVASDPVDVNVFTAPATPSIAGMTDICNGKSAELSGPLGFDYQWSDGETTQNISVSTEASITLIVKDANGCSSAASDPAVVACTNAAPVIVATTLKAAEGNTVSLDLISILSDPDGNIDITTLKIVSQPTSGAPATIDADHKLTIDYSNTTFVGTDHLSIGVCDIDAACDTKELTVNVAGDVIVYNGISPNGDTYNEVLFLENIDLLDDTRENKVSIFNRWGDLVFDVANYNNTTNAFRGKSNGGESLPTGTYYYKISFASSKKPMAGYLELKK